MELKKYNVTVLRFDMEKGTTSGETLFCQSTAQMRNTRCLPQCPTRLPSQPR
jgi:hypothetical protein